MNEVFGLRTRIVLIAAAAVMMAATASTFVSSYIFGREYTAAVESMLLAVGRAVEAPLERILDLGIDLDDLVGYDEQCRQAVAQHPDVAYAMVVDPDGRILFHSDSRQQVEWAEDDTGSPVSVEGGTDVAVRVRGGTAYYEATVPVSDPGRRDVGFVRVGAARELVLGKRRELLGNAVSAAALALFVAIVMLAAALTTWVNRPLGRLLSVIGRIREERTDLSRRVPITGCSELGQLSAAFNGMLAELESSQVEIQRHAANLEQAVEERTAELSQAKDAAESAAKARAAFLTNMSHEIRTPMTAILGYAESMLDPEMSEADRKLAIHTILRNGDHLLHVLNDILDLSKMEAGKLAIEVRRCSPLQIAIDVKALMNVRADAKGLRIELRCKPPIPETVATDSTRLRQILLNLVGNAVKFTRRGSIVVELRSETEPGQPPRLYFDVIDTGCGMRPDQAALLFEPFTQGDVSTSREFGGTGLGLSISRRLAQKLGGDVSIVRTVVGDGTHVRLTVATEPLDGVPLINAPDAEIHRLRQAGVTASPSAPVPVALTGKRILLVEDGVDNQRLIGHIFKKAGADVTIAENGQIGVDEALAAERAGEAFDVVFMDVQMPVMDGHTATRTLRSGGYRRPIVALTAYAMASDQEACLAAGCDDVSTKPIDRRKLVALAEHYCGVRQGGAATGVASRSQ